MIRWESHVHDKRMTWKLLSMQEEKTILEVKLKALITITIFLPHSVSLSLRRGRVGEGNARALNALPLYYYYYVRLRVRRASHGVVGVHNCLASLVLVSQSSVLTNEAEDRRFQHRSTKQRTTML